MDNSKGLDERLSWGETFTRDAVDLLNPIPVLGERNMYRNLKKTLEDPILAAACTLFARAYTYMACGLVAYRLYDAFK